MTVARAPYAVTLWRFTRPHTIKATTATVFTMWVIAGEFSATRVLDFVATLAVCLATNVYITGINQVTDVGIDLVNKPWLPIAAGTLSRQAALRVSLGCGLGALIAASLLSHWLLITVVIGLVVGSAYSLPPMRLKRFPLPAAVKWR
jgi:homogentisate phytyltransferase/homogentisate geranylgeranyltransferase